MRSLGILAALFGLWFGAQSATAADLSESQPYEAPPAPIWAGFYAGGHAGGLWSSDDSISLSKRCKSEYCYCWWCDSGDWKKVEHHKFTSDKDDGVSLVGGLHVGYNFQDDNLVYGIEADVSFSDNVDYLASLRARLGYAVNDLLIYATAGVAFAGIDDSQLYWEGRRGNYPVGESDDDDSKVGFVVGGGAEFKFAPNWSLGLEGLYYFFADSDDSYSWDKYCKEYKLTHEDDNDMLVVRARLSYHFQDAYDAPLK